MPAVIGLKEGRIVDKLVAPSPSYRYENQIMEHYEIDSSSNIYLQTSTTSALAPKGIISGVLSCSLEILAESWLSLG